MQAQRQRKIEQSSHIPAAATQGSGNIGSSMISSNLLRMNNNSLFPRNNLIDGNGQEGSSSSNLNGGGKLSSSHLDNSNGGGTQDGS